MRQNKWKYNSAQIEFIILQAQKLNNYGSTHTISQWEAYARAALAVSVSPKLLSETNMHFSKYPTYFLGTMYFILSKLYPYYGDYVGTFALCVPVRYWLKKEIILFLTSNFQHSMLLLKLSKNYNSAFYIDILVRSISY